MKRLISLLLILAMLAMAAGAAAEAKHCAIEIKVTSADKEAGTDVQIYLENGEMLITSALVPDTGFRISAPDPEELAEVYAGFSRILSNEKLKESILNCLKEWFAFMQPVTRNGFFSGDAFDLAVSVQEIRFSYGDLMLLAQKIRKEIG